MHFTRHVCLGTMHSLVSGQILFGKDHIWSLRCFHLMKCTLWMALYCLFTKTMCLIVLQEC